MARRTAKFDKAFLRGKLMELGISAGHASDLVNGKINPSYPVAYQMEIRFNVPSRFWGDNKNQLTAEEAVGVVNAA